MAMKTKLLKVKVIKQKNKKIKENLKNWMKNKSKNKKIKKI